MMILLRIMMLSLWWPKGSPEQRHFTKDQYDEAEAYQKAFAQN